MVLDPLVTRSLLALLGGALSGEAIVKGRSMFVGREGEEVAGPTITLVDDPTLAEAFGAATHDAEGVPTRRVELIAGGRFDGFLHNVYTARVPAPARARPAPRCAVGSSRRRAWARERCTWCRVRSTPRRSWRRCPTALYVQSVSGLHSGTNPVSGDFSVGAVGLVVRDGAFAEPVREVTIASTLQRMLHDVADVGADLTWLPGGAAGMTLLIADMSVSGA